MIEIKIERYVTGSARTYLKKQFRDLDELERWIFDQMWERYSNAMYFPTPTDKWNENCFPKAIEFCPIGGETVFYIHLIQNENGILFSDGICTFGKRHCSKNVQEWLIRCKDLAENPVFNFIE